MRRHFSTALIAASALSGGCAGSHSGAARSQPASNDSADLVLRDTRLLRLIDGKTVAKVSAAEVRYQREGGRYVAKDARASLFPGPQAKALESFGEVQIAAPSLAGDSVSQSLIAEGPVTARAARGDSARGEDVRWDGAGKRISSEKPVQISGAGYTLAGGGLSATTDGEQFELGPGASGTLSREGQP